MIRRLVPSNEGEENLLGGSVTAQISNFKVKVAGEIFCVEEVHPGSDRTRARTSHSVARNQIPIYKSNFSPNDLSVAFTKTDLKPLHNNLQCIKHQLCGVITDKAF